MPRPTTAGSAQLRPSAGGAPGVRSHWFTGISNELLSYGEDRMVCISWVIQQQVLFSTGAGNTYECKIGPVMGRR